jgi:putative ABC transport system ATP-binding protein
MDQILNLENVHKSYLVGKMPVYALRGVNLTIERGEFLTIMGPSGSGKSTLLHLCGALDTPIEGNIWFKQREKNLSTLSSDELANYRLYDVGIIFQSFNLVPSLTVKENILLPLIFAGKLSKKDQESALRTIIEKIGLQDRLNHYPSELSGGEQQRIAVARAIINNPAILLADEPTGNLDTKNGRIIMDLIHQIHDDGRTIIMVTHDPALAQEGNKTIHLLDGKIVE